MESGATKPPAPLPQFLLTRPSQVLGVTAACSQPTVNSLSETSSGGQPARLHALEPLQQGQKDNKAMSEPVAIRQPNRALLCRPPPLRELTTNNPVSYAPQGEGALRPFAALLHVSERMHAVTAETVVSTTCHLVQAAVQLRAHQAPTACLSVQRSSGVGSWMCVNWIALWIIMSFFY